MTNLGHNTLARYILPANANQILTSHGCFRSKCFAEVEHSSTVKNYLLRICDFKIRIAIAFAGSMNRVLHVCFSVGCWPQLCIFTHLSHASLYIGRTLKYDFFVSSCLEPVARKLPCDPNLQDEENPLTVCKRFTAHTANLSVGYWKKFAFIGTQYFTR